jgi:hypothetical protein
VVCWWSCGGHGRGDQDLAARMRYLRKSSVWIKNRAPLESIVKVEEWDGNVELSGGDDGCPSPS